MPRFVEDILMGGTTHGVYVCSLPNVRGEGPGEKHVLTRDPDRIQRFAKKWDQPGRGLFYCVSTITGHGPRDKDHYGETAILHADVDFKSITCSPEEALEAVLNLPVPPTRIHRTGNGLHLLWRLADAVAAMEEVERVLKLIRDCVGGDPPVAHCVALMRFPGSHNTKEGAWTEVTVERDVDQVWSLQEVAAVFASLPPAIVRKDRLAADDPFTRAANVMSFRPPIDVEARLASMRHGGAGDDGVHQTQLQVTASLLSSGWKLDDVVERVLEATRAAVGEAGSAWSWDEEKRNLVGMCEAWLAKHPPVKKAAGQDFRDQGDVVSLTEKRAERTTDKKSKAHEALGRGILGLLEKTGRALMTADDAVWLFEDGIWSDFRPEAWKQQAARWVEEGCRSIKLTSTVRLVNETRAWLERDTDIHRSNVPWDDHGLIATRSGLVDFRTLDVRPARADDYCSHRIDSYYDAEAGCPYWEQMLTDMGFDEPTKGLLQEVLGVALVDRKPRGLMRGLVLVGPSSTGKSNVLRVMARLLSDDPITTPLETLENTHGTQDFLRRAPWLLDEAFDQSRWHASATAKALLSGDHVGVNVKNGPFVSHVWRGAVLWGSNAPPQFKEQSRAMENRLLIVKCTREFDPARPTGAAREAQRRGYSSPAELVLGEERPGLLNWALLGLRRAWARGYLELTEATRANLEDMRMESNLAARFFAECVDFDKDTMVSGPDLYASFTAFWEEDQSRQVPSPDSFGRAVSALADRRIAYDRKALRFNSIRHYAGIRLNSEGLDYWEATSRSTGATGTRARISTSVSEVNRSIPSEWSDREPIRRMRLVWGVAEVVASSVATSAATSGV